MKNIFWLNKWSLRGTTNLISQAEFKHLVRHGDDNSVYHFQGQYKPRWKTILVGKEIFLFHFLFLFLITPRKSRMVLKTRILRILKHILHTHASVGKKILPVEWTPQVFPAYPWPWPFDPCSLLHSRKNQKSQENQWTMSQLKIVAMLPYPETMHLLPVGRIAAD